MNAPCKRCKRPATFKYDEQPICPGCWAQVVTINRKLIGSPRRHSSPGALWWQWQINIHTAPTRSQGCVRAAAHSGGGPPALVSQYQEVDDGCIRGGA